MVTPETDDFITNSEGNLINELTTELVQRYIPKNAVLRDLYEGKNKVKNLHIAVPKLMAGLKLCLGWPRQVVDAIVKRTLLVKIEDKNGSWLFDIFQANQGKLLAQKWHKDAGTYGTGYMLIGAGDPTQLEPATLLTVESPFSTVSKVGRSGELVALLKVVFNKEKKPDHGSLYIPGQVINFNYPDGANYVRDYRSQDVPFQLVDRFDTGIPFVPAEKIPNNPAGSDSSGSSEITPSIISATDSALRTLSQGEYAKEIYSHNQRVILDVDEETGKNIFENGLPSPVDGAWIFTRTEESGNALDGGKKYAPTPKVQELQAASPAPYLDWVKLDAQLIAGETGLPLSRLGWPGANPSSAEALRAEETELVRNANMRKDVFDAFWYRLSVKLFFITFGRFPNPGEFEYVSHWVQPDVQTPAADMDQAVKLSQINPALPGAAVILSRAGLSPEEVKTMVDAATDIEVVKGNMATVAQHALQNNPILEKLAQLNADPDEVDEEEV